MHSDTTSDQDSEKSCNQHKGPGQGAGQTASKSEGKALRLKENSDVRRLRRWHQGLEQVTESSVIFLQGPALSFHCAQCSFKLRVQVCVCELVSLPLPL